MPARALRIVDDAAPPEPEERVGDLDLTRETMSNWRTGQRICRSRKRHNWGPYTVREHKPSRASQGRTWYEVVEACTHCRNRRVAEFFITEWGLRKEGKWRPDYRDGYLLPHGAARITEEFHDELVAADILSRRIVEVLDDDDEE